MASETPVFFLSKNYCKSDERQCTIHCEMLVEMKVLSLQNSHGRKLLLKPSD